MSQFTVHRNPNVTSQALYPLLLDVQADLLGDLATRTVIPMTFVDENRRPAFQALTPICQVGERQYVVMTPMLAGIPARELGAPVADLSGDGPSIIAAIELLVKGL